MSEQDQETQSDTQINKTDGTESQPAIEAEAKRTLPKLSTGWWAVIAALTFFAVLGLCAAGSAAVHMATDRSTRIMVRTDEGRGFMTQGNGSGLRTGGMMGGRGDFEDSTTASTTRVNGVVTAVDGSTITVAGNGTTTKVVVDGSTTYIGDDKPAAVNDTIMAMGTKSGDTFTATRVVLQRQ